MPRGAAASTAPLLAAGARATTTQVRCAGGAAAGLDGDACRQIGKGGTGMRLGVQPPAAGQRLHHLLRFQQMGQHCSSHHTCT